MVWFFSVLLIFVWRVGKMEICFRDEGMRLINEAVNIMPYVHIPKVGSNLIIAIVLTDSLPYYTSPLVPSLQSLHNSSDSILLYHFTSLKF